MKNNLFVKALLLGLFTIAAYAQFYAKETIKADDVYVGQIYEITVEVITPKNDAKIYFEFDKQKNTTILNPNKPHKTKDSIKTYYTFFLKAGAKNFTTPQIDVTMIENDYSAMQKVELAAQTHRATQLNPPQNYAQIIAKELEVKKFKTSFFDDESNIVAVKIHAKYSDLSDFSVSGAIEQGIRQSTQNAPNHDITYFGVFDNQVDSFEFSYFDLDTKSYKYIEFPINSQRASVSTQTELHPHQGRIYQLKIYISAGFALLFVILFLFKRSYLIALLALLCIAYLFVVIKPLATVSVKKDSVVYILPTKNATAIVKLDENEDVKRLSRYKGYTKVEFDNSMIGWIKDDSIIKN